LRHAVQWSYDLLDDAEKALLDRCSVFAGGFDVESACAVAGSEGADGADEYVTLDRLDALVRKSLLVADRSSGRTRYSMLETIRQFAEDQLAARGEGDTVRFAHSRYFAGREADILALWDSPRQCEAYTWFSVELANLRAAFRWAADRNELDTAALLATYAGLVGFLAENYEPISWAEELIETARAVHHPRFQFLCQIASVCYMAGRFEAAIGYVEELAAAMRDGRDEVPFGLAGMAGGVYLMIGQPERCVEWCRAYIARGRNTGALTMAALVNALFIAGSVKEAITAADGLIDAAEATNNPWVLSYSLLCYGMAYRETDPFRALDALRRGISVTRESGNRFNESHLAHTVSGLEAKHGDPLAALDYVTLAIRNYHDAGSFAFIRPALANLAAILDGLGRYEPAATVASFAALSPIATAAFPEINTVIAHLRDELSSEAYQSLARKGESMTTSAMATYAYEQIDHARAELNAVLK
jgi:tetratricopeptide (TPR) repeat protein